MASADHDNPLRAALPNATVPRKSRRVTPARMGLDWQPGQQCGIRGFSGALDEACMMSYGSADGWKKRLHPQLP
jgi:hypothetical protein